MVDEIHRIKNYILVKALSTKVYTYINKNNRTSKQLTRAHKSKGLLTLGINIDGVE